MVWICIASAKLSNYHAVLWLLWRPVAHSPEVRRCTEIIVFGYEDSIASRSEGSEDKGETGARILNAIIEIRRGTCGMSDWSVEDQHKT